MIFKAISASFWIIPRLFCTSHDANVEVISGNALFRARASMAGAVLIAMGNKNNTRRDSTEDKNDFYDRRCFNWNEGTYIVNLNGLCYYSQPFVGDFHLVK